MFETILQRILSAIGAGDQVIAAMGPTLCILLAWVAGGALAQFLKFPLSRAIQEPWFSYIVRAIAMAATWFFAHVLSNTIPWPLEMVVGLVQPLTYHGSLALIRRYVPWLEAKKYVGAVCPPDEAFRAEAQRAADKAGENSGT